MGRSRPGREEREERYRIMKMDVTSVEDVQRQLDISVARVHEDLDKTAEAKNSMIEQLYSEARAKVVQDVEREREALEEDLRIARREAFAPPVLEGRNIDEAFVAKWYHEEIEKLRDETAPAKVLE